MSNHRSRIPEISIAALLLICLGMAASASAFQRRSPHKLRATALVELTRDSRGQVSTSLTPITILDNGQFQDASIYKSRPRPMAVEDGIVYETQKTGVPVGFLTIEYAEVKNDIWTANGRWQATAQPSQAPARSTSVQPSSSGNPGSGDDRPVLHRGGGGQSAPPPSVPQAAPPGPPPSSEPEPEPQDSDRPVLRRRKPAPDEVPAPTPTPNATRPTSHPEQRPAPPPIANSPGKQELVAVSDAEPYEARSFEFDWRPQEREQIEAKMRRLALDQLPGVKSQVNQPAMTNVVIRSFNVDFSNDAVVVITAEVPGGYLATETPAPAKKPAPRSGRKTPTAKSTQTSPPASEPPIPAKFVSRFIALIARIDIEGNPQKLAASVTDSSRLDVAPRLELIDAVDVDGDGLAELLFREYSFDQKSFIIYGIGHGTVTKVFEGASQPLR